MFSHKPVPSESVKEKKKLHFMEKRNRLFTVSIIIIALTIIVFDFSVRLLEPTGLISSLNIQKSAAEKVTLNINFTDPVKLSLIGLQRQSPIGNRTPLYVVKTNEESINTTIENQYLSGIILTIPHEYVDQIEHIELTVGKETYAIEKNELEVRLREDNAELNINADSVPHATSFFPSIKNIINFKGILKTVIPGFLFSSLFLIIVITIVLLKNKYKISNRKMYLMITLCGIIVITFTHFILTWRILSVSYSDYDYWFFFIKTAFTIIVLVFSLSFYNKEKNTRLYAETTSPSKKSYYFLIFLVLIITISLRITNIDVLSMTTDEVYIGISMKQVLSNLKPIMPDGTYYGRGVPHVYFASLFSLIPFISFDTAVRLPSVLSGLVTVYIIFLIVKKYSSTLSGILAALFVAIFPWTVEFSRWGRMYSMVALFILLTVLFALYYVGSGKVVYLLGSIISIFMAIYTDIWGYYSIVVLLCALIIRFLMMKKRRSIDVMKKNWKKILIFFLIGTSIFILFMMNFPLLSQFFQKIWNYTQQIEFSAFFLQFFIFNFTILLIGVVILLKYSFPSKQSDRIEYMFLCFISIGALIFVSFYHLHDTPRYLFFVFILFFPAAYIGFDLLVAQILEWFNIKKLYIVSISTFFLFTFSLVNIGYTFSIPFRQHGDYYFNMNYAPTTVSNYIADHENIFVQAAEILQNNDIYMSNSFQFSYYYTGIEPDYWLRPGNKNFFLDSDRTVKYMKHTELISNEKKLLEELQKSNFSRRIVVAVNFKGGHEGKSEIIKKWLYTTLPEYYNVETVFKGDEPFSRLIIARPLGS